MVNYKRDKKSDCCHHQLLLPHRNDATTDRARTRRYTREPPKTSYPLNPRRVRLISSASTYDAASYGKTLIFYLQKGAFLACSFAHFPRLSTESMPTWSTLRSILPLRAESRMRLPRLRLLACPI